MIYPKLPDGTIDWCVMCKHEGRDLYDGCCECEYSENSDDPPSKYELKPTTNADRLRSMSDEELAKWLCDMAVCQLCPIADCPGTRDCEARWIDWLRQEDTDA